MDVFADAVGGLGPVLDVGCGPGTVTAYLVDRGVDASGVDLSPRMIEHARRLHPRCRFGVASSTDLDLADSSFARALVLSGQLIIATHVGDGDVARTEAYGGVAVSWTTYLRQPEQLAALVEQAGLRPVAELRLPAGGQVGPGVVLAARRDQ